MLWKSCDAADTAKPDTQKSFASGLNSLSGEFESHAKDFFY